VAINNDSKLIKYGNRYRTVLYVYGFLAVIFIVFSIFFPLFRSPRNLSNIFIQISPLAIIAIGQTIALLGGGVDLSVGAVVSLTTVIAANLMGASTFGIIGWVIIILLGAAFIGLVNGVICNETNIPPLIATLATSSIIQGLNLWYRMAPGGDVPRGLRDVLMHKFGILSTPIIIVIILYFIFTFIMSRSPFGVHVYAVGGSEIFARMAGINVKKVRIGTYIISATLAAIAGLIIASRIGSGVPNVGNPYMLDSLTAVIVGGTTFAGGQGFVLGSLAGAVIISVISNALNISGVSPFYQYIAKGSILLIAMIINSRRKKV
jgi:ribose/xylose/arabinose/galactoside ABC-type transport system permease subunit